MKRLAVVMATVVTTLTLAAVPAQASLSECDFGYVCGYDGDSANGLLFEASRVGGTCYNLSSSANDRANSFFNNLANGKHIQLYRNAGCQGQLLRDQTEWTGPFPANYAARIYKPSCCFGDGDQNKLSSVFFNTG